MSDWIGFFKLVITLSFILALAVLIVLAMPMSPLRNALMPFCKLGFAVLCGIYVVSPLDFIPEAALGPFGLIDDFGALVVGANAALTAFRKPKEVTTH